MINIMSKTCTGLPMEWPQAEVLQGSMHSMYPYFQPHLTVTQAIQCHCTSPSPHFPGHTISSATLLPLYSTSHFHIVHATMFTYLPTNYLPPPPLLPMPCMHTYMMHPPSTILHPLCLDQHSCKTICAHSIEGHSLSSCYSAEVGQQLLLLHHLTSPRPLCTVVLLTLNSLPFVTPLLHLFCFHLPHGPYLCPNC